MERLCGRLFPASHWAASGSTNYPRAARALFCARCLIRAPSAFSFLVSHARVRVCALAALAHRARGRHLADACANVVRRVCVRKLEKLEKHGFCRVSGCRGRVDGLLVGLLAGSVSCWSPMGPPPDSADDGVVMVRCPKAAMMPLNAVDSLVRGEVGVLSEPKSLCCMGMP